MHMAQRYNYGSYVSDTQSRMNYRGTTPPASVQPAHNNAGASRAATRLSMMCANSPLWLSLTVSRSRDTLFLSLADLRYRGSARISPSPTKINANARIALRTFHGNFRVGLFVKVLRYLTTMITIIIIIIILLLAFLHT